LRKDIVGWRLEALRGRLGEASLPKYADVGRGVPTFFLIILTPWGGFVTLTAIVKHHSC
jgi:hypothetical protein